MEKNLAQRFAIIGVAVLLAALILYFNRLEPGLDIAGGVSMVFEIDDRGLEGVPNLADDMKSLLQKRVDPDGIYNLVWRVVGRNRIEIQMPLPSADTLELRKQYSDAQQKLFESNLARSDIDRAFQAPNEERAAKIAALAAGDANRERLLTQAASQFDALTAATAALRAAEAAAQAATQAATQPETMPATTPEVQGARVAQRDASEALEDAIDVVMETNLDPTRFQETLDLDAKSPIRTASLTQFKEKHPALIKQIEDVEARHALWKSKRGFLDGPADLRRLLRGAGVLEWRMLAEPSPDNFTRYDRLRKQLEERGPRPAPGDTEGWFRIDNPLQFLNLRTPAELNREPRSFEAANLVVDKVGTTWFVLGKLGAQDGLLANSERKWQLQHAGVTRDQQGRLAVDFQLDLVGGDQFLDLTRRNINKQLCILVDNVAYSTARIHSAIATRGQITGDFSREKVNYLVNTMQAGALPARLKDTPILERTIGSSLGQENLRKAVWSGVYGAMAVIGVMLVYYMTCGALANVAMSLNVFFVLSIMALLHARFTLDGIAGVILSIGMAVDANVLIYERMREEKERGASLRMLVKNGFEKAFGTIFDSNITTLLICVILYYVGSEEVRGFGLTLGWGIVLNLFTSVYVTRALFALLMRLNLIKDIRMMKVIGVPQIDWWGMRKRFIALSAVVIVSGLLLMSLRGARDLLDVEFLGGVSAEIATKAETGGKDALNDVKIADALGEFGRSLETDARKLSLAVVEPTPGDSSLFRLRVPDVQAARIEALLKEPMEEQNLSRRDGVDASAGPNEIAVRVQEGVTADTLRQFVTGRAASAVLSAKDIARANVNSVVEAGQSSEKFWNITTTETNKSLVQHALITALGDRLAIQPRIGFVFTGRNGDPFPITDRVLENVVPDLPVGTHADLTDYLGGAAIRLDRINPPQTTAALYTRLRNMRLQPGYQDLPWRKFDVIGIVPAPGEGGAPLVSTDGAPLYTGVVIAIVDEAFPYGESAERWSTDFARREVALASAALDTEQTLRKVAQFKPQIANQSRARALIALVLSWGMIIIYVWIRFGKPVYGVAGVIALVHDVLVALAFVGLSGWAARTFLGQALLVEDFKINLAIIAALLTIIGYSINDTIVIFDRVREVRGRLGIVTPEIINRSINECMSRTILTTFTVFVTLLAMYIFGGSSIRGFNYCMLIGTISGTYSTIAIATPLLLLGTEVKAQPARA
ncbi:MAG: protein translocase subunit SecD [Phycisphaerae bacterium]